MRPLLRCSTGYPIPRPLRDNATARRTIPPAPLAAGAWLYHAAMARKAAALIIGNEILTGKIQETNMRELATELFQLGISLERVVICRDEVDTIAADLELLRRRHDVVFTTGGVGPTHDDVTHRAVAQCFGRRLVRSHELESLIRGALGDRCTEGHLLMADIPEGAKLISSKEVRWPTVLIENVFVLPGLPKVFRLKLPGLV